MTILRQWPPEPALFGFVHARRVNETDELLVHQPRPATVVTH
jgi:hypothetical protein